MSATGDVLRKAAAFLTTPKGSRRGGGCHALGHALLGDWTEWHYRVVDSDAYAFYAMCEPPKGEGWDTKFWYAPGINGHPERVIALCLAAAIADDAEAVLEIRTDK